MQEKYKIILTSIVTVAIILAVLFIIPTKKINENYEPPKTLDNCGEGTVIAQDKEICWQKSTKLETTKSWEDANNYCKNLILGKHRDWRLPTITELLNIVELNYSGVSIDTRLFVNTEKIHYWTSTPFKGRDDFHWYVHFDIGEQGYAPNFKENYGVRCVRDNSFI